MQQNILIKKDVLVTWERLHTIDVFMQNEKF